VGALPLICKRPVTFTQGRTSSLGTEGFIGAFSGQWYSFWSSEVYLPRK